MRQLGWGSIANTRGLTADAGDADVEFTIMSVAEPFVFALMCGVHTPTGSSRPTIVAIAALTNIGNENECQIANLLMYFDDLTDIVLDIFAVVVVRLAQIRRSRRR